MDLIQKDEFYRKYDLDECRENKSVLEPVIHQKKALKSLQQWFKTKQKPYSGGILALPTGAGKTFVAVRFLCEHPLKKGYKVLWLAHTHHLLEQAFFTFGPKYEDSKNGFEVGFINEYNEERNVREELNVRVVSGAKNNFPPKQIDRDDDVVIGTLQTIRGAYNNKLRQLMSFLDSADDKLFVVFDEAHHAVAPSYRRLLFDLREKYPEMCLLGLTATPTASNESKEIILRKVFPQFVIADATLDELMRQRILARPKFETKKTNIDVEFDFGDYQRWTNTYRDLPKKIIKDLAENEDRNKIIAQSYVNEAKKYGKTIIFTDRWYQCVTLCRFLRKRDVKADVMFNMVDKNLGTAGTTQRNLDVLEKFKKGKLDVLINIRMLTEGTDVPDADSVFLTRQTTSKILLTQMIGRALRGPEFGGTDVANIVSFVDNWDYDINWAEWEELPIGPTPPDPLMKYRKVPVELMSIRLIDDAARRADSDDQYEIESFISLMPVGWYLTEFDTRIRENDDFKSVKDFVLVFEHKEKNEKDCYDKCIEKLKKEDLELFEGEDLEFNLKSKETKYQKINDKLNLWYKTFFSSDKEDQNKLRYLFMIARHMAQNDKSTPHYFEFEKREKHNIDNLAKKYVAKELGVSALNNACLQEYNKQDRYWKAFYPEFIKFKSEVDYWIARIMNPPENGKIIKPYKPGKPPERRDRTPEETRKLIFQRDNHCLCCGEDNIRLFEVDHIIPNYYVTDESEENLQTLCKICNKEKGIKKIDFRENKSKLKKIPSKLPEIQEMLYLEKEEVKNIQLWQKFLKRKVNLFYECSAVQSVNIGKRGLHLYNWEIILKEGNNKKLIEHFVRDLTDGARTIRDYYGFKGPDVIIIK